MSSKPRCPPRRRGIKTMANQMLDPCAVHFSVCRFVWFFVHILHMVQKQAINCEKGVAGAANCARRLGENAQPQRPNKTPLLIF